jgi:hypothetical protein
MSRYKFRQTCRKETNDVIHQVLGESPTTLHVPVHVRNLNLSDIDHFPVDILMMKNSPKTQECTRRNMAFLHKGTGCPKTYITLLIVNNFLKAKVIAKIFWQHLVDKYKFYLTKFCKIVR